MLTGGAATPVVADVAVAVGSGTAVFGAADAIEGTQDIYYGSTGDIDSTVVNGITGAYNFLTPHGSGFE